MSAASSVAALALCFFTLCVLLLGASTGVASPVPLTIHSPQLLARVGVNMEMSLFGAPLIQGRDCRGTVKLMSMDRSCASESTLRSLGARVDNRAVMDWETVPPDDDYRGRIVLVRRGGCSFHVKALEAERAGAVGVLVVNDAPTDALQAMTFEGSLPPPHIPIAMVTLAAGSAMETVVEALPDGVVVGMCANVNQQRYV